jgi:hypothetical protein
VFALGTDFAYGILGTRYPKVVAPSYAAVLGTIVTDTVMTLAP